MAEKRKRKKAYLDDFKKTASGEYSYEGALYYMEEAEEGRRKKLFLLWGLCIGIFLFLLLCGCIPAAGMDHSALVILPYTAEWIAAVLAGSAMYRITAGGNPLREYVYESSVKKLPSRLTAVEICTAVTIAGEIICLIRQGDSENMGYTVLFCFLQAAVIMMARGKKRLLFNIKWRSNKNESTK